MVAGLLKGEAWGREVEALRRVGDGSWPECSSLPEDARDATGGSGFEETACRVRQRPCSGSGTQGPRPHLSCGSLVSWP